MAGGHDITAHLADDVLLHIFSLLPIESIIRTRAVCKRWNSLFPRIQLHLTTLDFGEDFACGRSAIELLGSVLWSLRLLGGNKLKAFKLRFDAFFIPMSLLEGLLESVIYIGIEEIDLGFCVAYGPLNRDELYGQKKKFMLPSCLFQCKRLTRFRLAISDLGIPPGFTGFTLLRELHLFDVDIDDEMLQTMIVTCPSIELLYLIECSQLVDVRIWGLLQLKLLSIIDIETVVLEVDAPKLRSFYYKGNSDEFEITNVASVVDAIIFSLPRDSRFNGCYLWVNILAKLENVEILTLSTDALVLLDECEFDGCIREPIIFHKVTELQLLIDQERGHVFCKLNSFFRDCTFPSLEKLFIELSVYGSLSKTKIPELDNPNLAFDNLTLVKISNCHGYRYEILLMKFLLEKAVNLEFMVLIAADPDEAANRSGSYRRHLKIAFEELLLFPKASSKAQLMLYENGEDSGFAPMHTKSQCAPHFVGKGHFC